MKRTILLLIACLLTSTKCFAVEFTDSNSSCHNPWKITYSDDNLTCNSNNSVSISDASGSGGGDEITVNTTAATNANFLDNLYYDWALNTASTPDDITVKPNYNASSGDFAFLTNECAWAVNGLVCEGVTADTIEIFLQFPDPATTDKTITFFNATDTVVGKATTDTLTNKTLAAADNVIDADTAVALAANGANCSAGSYPLGVDDSGASESCTDATTEIDSAISTHNVANNHVDHTSVTLTAGAGLSGGGDISASRSFATASGEADFIASGALTCGASTQGKAQVHTTPLQYCDNAATPALQYAAYGDSSGNATGLVCTGCAGATDLGTDSVSADELNATGVEAELESTLDIGGEVTSTGMASTVIGDSITVTGWVLGTSSATTLTSDAFTSDVADPADAGVLRLGNAEIIGWEASPAGTDETLTLSSGENFQLSSPLELDASDPADAGALRLDNAENIAWEASPAGTDVTLGVDSGEILQASGAFNSGGALTEGGNAVFNSSETPGGELEGTWATPTIDNTGITLTSITIGSLLGVDSIDATGGVDMDYGSADITDHTFTSDGGTTIIDGAITSSGENIEFHAMATGLSGGSSGGLVIVSQDDGTAMLDTERLGSYSFFGAEDTAGNILEGAAISAFAKGTWSATSHPSSLSFYTVNDGSTTVTERMLIAINGDIQQTTAGTTLFIGGLIDAIGAVDMDYGSGDITDHTFITDGTGTAEIVLPAGSIDSTEILNGTIVTADMASNVSMTSFNLPVQSAKITGDFVVFTPPTADACTQGAGIDAGQGNWRLLFEADSGVADECATWQFVMPNNYASTPLLDVIFSMASGEANEVEFEAAIMCYTPTTDTADIGTASFSNVAVGTATTVSATAGEVYLQTITLTDDSCAAGDIVFIVLSTDANDATNDDATGDREVVGVNFRYTGS